MLETTWEGSRAGCMGTGTVPTMGTVPVPPQDIPAGGTHLVQLLAVGGQLGHDGLHAAPAGAERCLR